MADNKVREDTIKSVLMNETRANKSFRRSDSTRESSLNSLQYICCLCTYLDDGVLEGYQALARWNTVFHVASAGVELWDVSQVFKRNTNGNGNLGLIILAVLLTLVSVINAGLCFRLIFSISKSLCLYSVFFSVIAIMLFVITLIYGSIVLQNNHQRLFAANAILSGLQIVIQFLPMFFMYRFWTYLTYNHDFNSSGSSLSADGRSARSLNILVSNSRSRNAADSSVLQSEISSGSCVSDL